MKDQTHIEDIKNIGTKMLHKDENYLKRAMESGKTSRDISKELGVSYKLVEIYLEKYQIPFTSMVPLAKED